MAKETITEKVIAEDYKAVLHEAKSMGCNNIRALYNIPLKNMELIIKALEEVQQYRAIGTPEEFRVSVEKQTAKKPYLQPVQKNEYREDECWECPSCDSFLGYEVDCRDDHYRENYCPYCGQKLDWSDEE